jgi:hypothetical protein
MSIPHNLFRFCRERSPRLQCLLLQLRSLYASLYDLVNKFRAHTRFQDSAMACLLINKDVICIWNDKHFKIKLVLVVSFVLSCLYGLPLFSSASHLKRFPRKLAFIVHPKQFEMQTSPRSPAAMMLLLPCHPMANYSFLRSPNLLKSMLQRRKATVLLS